MNEELERADTAYTAAVQAAASGHGDWSVARHANTVCQQIRARINTAGETV